MRLDGFYLFEGLGINSQNTNFNSGFRESCGSDRATVTRPNDYDGVVRLNVRDGARKISHGFSRFVLRSLSLWILPMIQGNRCAMPIFWVQRLQGNRNTCVRKIQQSVVAQFRPADQGTARTAGRNDFNDTVFSTNLIFVDVPRNE